MCIPVYLCYFWYVILTCEVAITNQTMVKTYHLASDIKAFVDLMRVVTLGFGF